ncbi:hypothetical protein [Salinifilum aidingensis]
MSAHQYAATATREGEWWIVQVGELGTTQGRSVAEARTMARDLAATVLDVPLTDVDVTVTFEVGGALEQEVQQAREATYEAELAQAEAARRYPYRKVVADMKASGLSGADIAAILELSPQRVSQLAKQTPDQSRERTAALQDWARQRGLDAPGHEHTPA